METRFLTGGTTRLRLESRAEGELPTIVGYGAVFYDGTPETEFKLWSDTVERIAPGAFDRSMKEDDPASFLNHNPDNILGRKSAGTVRLKVDKRGLLYEIDPPNTEPARVAVTAIERRELLGSSFTFVPKRVVWIEEDDLEIRQIEDVELWEVGPVMFPAYAGTTTGIRSGDAEIEAIRQEHAAWKRDGELPGIRALAAARMCRSRTLDIHG